MSTPTLQIIAKRWIGKQSFQFDNIINCAHTRNSRMTFVNHACSTQTAYTCKNVLLKPLVVYSTAHQSNQTICLSQRRCISTSPAHHYRSDDGNITRKLKQAYEKTYYKLRQQYDIHFRPEWRGVISNMAKGTKTEWNNVKVFFDVLRRPTDARMSNITYGELMTVHAVKRDILKSAPLLVVFLMPFGMCMIMTVAIIPFFRRFFMPESLWSQSQRHVFLRSLHANRLMEYSIIVNHMNYHKLNDDNVNTRYVLDTLCNASTSGRVPKNHDLLQLKPLCTEHPFNGVGMVYTLLRSFCYTAGVSPYQPKDWIASSLCKRADLILKLDSKLRVQGPQWLSARELEDATFMRGLNSTQLSREANLYWLENWLRLTMHCSNADYWFVLHAMALLSQNYTESQYRRGIFR